jgi:mono/diheme cytochrome c family protein
MAGNMKTILFFVAMMLPAIAFPQTNNTTGNAENGKRLFLKQNCYYCHGTTGQGTRDGARLAQTALNLQGLMRYVRQPTGGMPAFTSKILSDQELTDIYAYLKSLPAAKAPKDIPLLEQIK